LSQDNGELLFTDVLEVRRKWRTRRWLYHFYVSFVESDFSNSLARRMLKDIPDRCNSTPGCRVREQEIYDSGYLTLAMLAAVPHM
jgi:hypothetical protein